MMVGTIVIKYKDQTIVLDLTSNKVVRTDGTIVCGIGSASPIGQRIKDLEAELKATLEVIDRRAKL